MPLVNIKVAGEVTEEQKTKLIAGATELIADVLGKSPAVTWVVIDEVRTENWGTGGISIAERNRGAAG